MSPEQIVELARQQPMQQQSLIAGLILASILASTGGSASKLEFQEAEFFVCFAAGPMAADLRTAFDALMKLCQVDKEIRFDAPETPRRIL